MCGVRQVFQVTLLHIHQDRVEVNLWGILPIKYVGPGTSYPNRMLGYQPEISMHTFSRNVIEYWNKKFPALLFGLVCMLYTCQNGIARWFARGVCPKSLALDMLGSYIMCFSTSDEREPSTNETGRSFRGFLKKKRIDKQPTTNYENVGQVAVNSEFNTDWHCWKDKTSSAVASGAKAQKHTASYNEPTWNTPLYKLRICLSL